MYIIYFKNSSELAGHYVRLSSSVYVMLYNHVTVFLLEAKQFSSKYCTLVLCRQCKQRRCRLGIMLFTTRCQTRLDRLTEKSGQFFGHKKTKMAQHSYNNYIHTTITFIQQLHSYNNYIHTTITFIQQLHSYSNYIHTAITFIQQLHSYSNYIHKTITFIQQLHSYNNYIHTTTTVCPLVTRVYIGKINIQLLPILSAFVTTVYIHM
jgi:hypothetical protein